MRAILHSPSLGRSSSVGTLGVSSGEYSQVMARIWTGQEFNHELRLVDSSTYYSVTDRSSGTHDDWVTEFIGKIEPQR
jgi:hypothetical protein